MEGSIIQIGNSSGVIIPANILHKTGMKRKSRVDISVNEIDNTIVISNPQRQGWAAAAKRQHEEGEDKLLNADILDDDLKDIEW